MERGWRSAGRRERRRIGNSADVRAGRDSYGHDMAAEAPSVQRVEVTFVGPAPVRSVVRASGVSDVEADGSRLRCVVSGSFQPFLEALRGHEVLRLVTTSAAAPLSAHRQL